MDFLLNVFKQNSSKVAIIHKEESFTYEWLLDSFKKWNEFLLSNDIESNSVIAVRADFSPDSVGLILALIDRNCIIVPLSLSLKNIKEYIGVSEAEHYIDLTTEKIKKERLNIEARHELLIKLKKIRHPGLILFSSGTTGKPKAALHDLTFLLEKYKLPRETLRTLAFLLFDHIGGFNTLMSILANGGTLITIDDRSPEEVCKFIEKYQVELLPTSPTFINMILFSRAFEKYNIACLKMVTYGTEPMPETTLKNFHKLFPRTKLKQTYGLSEIGIMRSRSEASDSLWIKVGGEDYETKIVEGKLWIKAKTAMLGYLNAPSPFSEDGWLNTGDRVEEKGEYLKFLGRDSDIINVGGEKVYPIEVESVILEIEGVKDVIVYGEPNPLMGNIVVADVKVGEKNDLNEFKIKIMKYCRERLEKYKVPIKLNLVQKDFNSTRFKKMRHEY